jgi:hypothetical protein
MSESKVTATKVARLGVLGLALLAALVAVQAFGAKPAEAMGFGGVVRLVQDPVDVGRLAAARLAEEPARLEADDAAKLMDHAARQEPEEAAARWPDDPNLQGADTEVAKRTEALKSKIEDSREYVEKGACLIVDFAGIDGGPPTDYQVRSMVETDVPAKYLLVESEEGSGFDVVKRKQVKSELVEINQLVRKDMEVSSSNDEPDGGDIVSEVGNVVCKLKEAWGGR